MYLGVRIESPRDKWFQVIDLQIVTDDSPRCQPRQQRRPGSSNDGDGMRRRKPPGRNFCTRPKSLKGGNQGDES